MQLLVIRHAIAEDRDDFAKSGASDDDRPLTSFGRQRMVRNVRGLRRVVPRLTTLASSPLRRAKQTADIIAHGYGIRKVSESEALRPGKSMRDFLRWLKPLREEEVVAVVGHEPHLGTLVTWLMIGVEEPKVAFKKGGAVLLEFGEILEPGSATLLLAIAPAQLRRLGE
ncbi:MAG: SixA phosphatase family protein [Gemmatimonadaceae bacterium]